ncbi:hypothetical protein DYB31_016803 [Aphanomyces astaci]|uniref:Uncharacterized protein n=1 Tax=Aphanomyces astaci TaxID=112090 RepID=A0A397FG93_APHAT|nr:hypothetical protein DYB31_016803 [Aphanomyces astaci]
MKGLIRAFSVLDSDVRRIRHHLDAAANVQPGTTSPPPLTLDTHKVVGAALTEWLSINRSTNEVLAKAIQADIEYRACALVQVSLSDTVRRHIAAANLEKCVHCIITKLHGKYCSEEQKHATAIAVYLRLYGFKFRPHAPLDANLQDGRPSQLVNFPQVVAVDELKADPAATAVANVTAKVAGVVEEPGHPSSTPFAKATLPAAVQATPAWDKAAIPATPVSITAIIAMINAAVARLVSRSPAIVVAQATGTATTATTAGPTVTTAGPTVLNAGPTVTTVGPTVTTVGPTVTTVGLFAPTAAPTKMTGTTVAAVTPCTTTVAIVAAAAARCQPTKATTHRHPPPSAAKAAARLAVLPER